MKKKLYIVISLLSFLLLPMLAQVDSDTLRRSLVITEVKGNDERQGYIELTNMSDDTLDLSKFWYMDARWQRTFSIDDFGDLVSNARKDLELFPLDDYGRIDKKLAPGDHYIIMSVMDHLAIGGGFLTNMDILPHVNLAVHQVDGERHTFHTNQWFPVRPELLMFGYDSVNKFGNAAISSDMGCALYFETPSGRMVCVDGYGLNIDWDGNARRIRAPNTLAGIENASERYMFVRKFNVKLGNPDWTSSAGADLEDSEWIPIPVHFAWNRHAFTTVNNHGDFSVDFTSDVYTVDHTAGTITVPWGTQKYESQRGEDRVGTYAHQIPGIIDGLNMELGQGWYYQEMASPEDSLYWSCQTGDTLRVYGCGNALDLKAYRIIVDEPDANMAEVVPKRRPHLPELNPYQLPQGHPMGNLVTYKAISEITNENRKSLILGTPFYVTKGIAGMDTIGEIPFACRVDTLQEYLEKAPKASWEIVTWDGLDRVDLQKGDKLKVTAEDGSTVKEYYLIVNSIPFKSDNNNLAAIVWPDIPEDFYGEGWKGDTIPLFNPGGSVYTVTMPYGMNDIPSLQPIPQDLNAVITVEQRAISLRGSLEDRTTVFRVTSEDGSKSRVYKVIFKGEIPPNILQPNKIEPFISKLGTPLFSGLTEICNPSNQPLLLDNYMIVKGTSSNPATSMGQNVATTNYANRYRHYVPGYKFAALAADWELEPAKLEVDVKVNSVVEPGDVFLAVTHEPDRVGRTYTHFLDVQDVGFLPAWTDGMIGMTWPEEYDTYSRGGTVPTARMDQGNEYLFLFKITNDSVLNGTKPVGDIADYELIDAVGNPSKSKELNGWGDLGGNSIYIRKPHINSGRTDYDMAFGMPPDSCEWYHTLDPNESNWIRQESWKELVYRVGNHAMEEVTGFKSTITSMVYLISDGYESPQSLQGDMTDMKVSTLLDNVIKADTAQSLEVISGTTGNILGADEAVAASDTVKVVSADGNNMTKYVIDSTPVSSDAVLVAKDGSGLTVSVDGSEGSITGMAYTTTISEVVDSLVKPAGATMNIIDADGVPVTASVQGADGELISRTADHTLYFEVIAADGTTITYQLVPDASSNDAFVTSNFYAVDQEKMVIDGIPQGINVSEFLSNVIPVKGATITLLDKAGNGREMGDLSLDDKLKVVSEDGSIEANYYLNFIGEVNVDYNQAPLILFDSTELSLTIDAPTVNLEPTVTDDGNPYPSVLTYEWTVSSGVAENVTISAPDQTSTDVTFSEIGVYGLQLSVSDGEIVTADTVQITVTWATGIESGQAAGMLIYPNPAGDIFHISTFNIHDLDAEIMLRDIVGRVVYHEIHPEAEISIDVSGLDAGIYFVRMKAGDLVVTRKLQIVK